MTRRSAAAAGTLVVISIRSLGRALLDHNNVPLIYAWSEDRELHFATNIILGDPTLTLQQTSRQIKEGKR